MSQVPEWILCSQNIFYTSIKAILILGTAKFCLMVFRMHFNSNKIFRITASISCKSSLADIISFILSWIDKENRSYILDSFRKSSKSVLVFGWLYNNYVGLCMFWRSMKIDLYNLFSISFTYGNDTPSFTEPGRQNGYIFSFVSLSCH